MLVKVGMEVSVELGVEVSMNVHSLALSSAVQLPSESTVPFLC